VSRFDIFDGDIGLFASAGEDGAAMLLTGGESLGIAPSSGVALPLRLGDWELEADLGPADATVTLDGELTGSTTVELCTATGALRGAGEAQELDCPALRTTGGRPTGEGVAIARSIAIVLGDGSLLALAAARAGAGEADEERVSAAFAQPGEPMVAFEEPLLSTEYDGEGRHRRATLELWPPEGSDQRVMRGGGNRVAGDAVQVGAHRHEVALFTWSVGGVPGLGRYEIIRAT